MKSTQRTTPYYWQGAWIDESEAESRLGELGRILPTLPGPLDVGHVLAACGRLSAFLTNRAGAEYRQLFADLTDPATTGLPAADAEASLTALAHALSPASLAAQLTAELGGITPDRPVAAPFADGATELWQPVGTLVHIAPRNVAVAGVMSAVDGLLAGNVNVVKTSGMEGLFTQHALAALAAADPSGQLRRRLVVLRFSSRNTTWMRELCRPADAVTVWGTEEAVAGVTQFLPAGCRLVEWGPKISLTYLDRTGRRDMDALRGLARDVLRNGQRTCTSPQVVYVDTLDADVLFAKARAVADALAAEAANVPALAPSTAEQAEITNVVTVARLEEHLGLTRAFSAPDGRWHVLADTRPGLSASPLFGTVWVKPLPREDIVRVLHPMRRYLQTVGLHAAADSTMGLSYEFFRAGALRVTPLGAMLDSYAGEPHDGHLTLQRYSRRVSITVPER
ncbi:acyl-CoA reductase [Streptomyces tailanensis]|uniref:acyl-CoA reductase n=1 Tax=Streptomyces tailanensis TaxID=2569858 RepID=UPI00122E70CD|nr:acyl-CoA reductase [Streptomyces tailanensis]